ncbi:MAG: hypothetical protein ABGY43_10760 [bacterium]|jgi:hypothetical protein
MGDAYWNLANLKTFRFEPEEVDQMRTLVSAGESGSSDHYHLCFALGKALEDLGEYAESFQYYTQGNARKCEQEGCKADETTAQTEALITHRTTSLFEGKET